MRLCAVCVVCFINRACFLCGDCVTFPLSMVIPMIFVFGRRFARCLWRAPASALFRTKCALSCQRLGMMLGILCCSGCSRPWNVPAELGVLQIIAAAVRKTRRVMTRIIL